MRKLAFFLLLYLTAAPIHAQGQPQNVKGTFGYGAPDAANTAASAGVGTQYTDLSTGTLYVCTAVTLSPTSTTCTWTQAGGGGGSGTVTDGAGTTTAGMIPASTTRLH